MRKLISALVVVLAVVVLSAAVGWAVFGERLVMVADQYRTAEEGSIPVRNVRYVGDGTGGVLWMDIGEKALALFNLNPADATLAAPHVGTTPKNELAISFAGKVFVCGAIPTDSPLAINIPGDDHATLTSRRSLISWPTWFEAADPKHPNTRWKRNWYYEFSWKRPSGATLWIRWRYQQPFRNGRWDTPATDAARLSDVEIRNR